MKKMRLFGIAALAVLWAALTCAAWFGPAKDTSESERRKLAQFPELTVKTVPGSVYEGMTEKSSPYSGRLPAAKMCTSSAAALQMNLLSGKVITKFTLSFLRCRSPVHRDTTPVKKFFYKHLLAYKILHCC